MKVTQVDLETMIEAMAEYVDDVVFRFHGSIHLDPAGAIARDDVLCLCVGAVRAAVKELRDLRQQCSELESHIEMLREEVAEARAAFDAAIEAWKADLDM
jgi:hypothetical protein